MRLKLPASKFLTMARSVLQFVAKGASVDPGLGFVRIDVGENLRLRMTAQDLTVGARVWDPGVWEGEPGTLVISSHHLDRIVSVLQDTGKVSMSVDNMLRIESGRLRMDAPLKPVEEFFPLPDVPGDGWYEVEERTLSEIARRTKWAVADGTVRPTMAGVNLRPECSQSSDGYKLSRLVPGIMPGDQSIIVPSEALNVLRSLIKDSSEIVKMNVESNRLWLHASTWLTYTLLVAGTYPDTSPLLLVPGKDGFHRPEAGVPTRVHTVYVNRHELLAIFRRIGASSIDNPAKKMGAGILFDYRPGDGLHIVARHDPSVVAMSIGVDDVANWAEGTVTEDEPQGFECLRTVDFYYHYVTQALESLPSDTVRMMWADGQRIGGMPLQFHDDGGVVAMVMPRRL